MDNKRRQLTGNLKPNHFVLTLEDEYPDHNAQVPNIADTLITKVKVLSTTIQKAADQALERITKLKNFLEYCRDVNQLNIGAHTTESLCVYFEDSGDTLKQFELMLDKLDTEHPKIKSMRINFEELRKLIAKGEDSIKSENFRDSIEIYAEALKIEPSNKLIRLDLLYDRAFANSKIGNFRDAIADCNRAFSIDPIHTRTRLLRAECSFYLEDFENCIEDYEFALLTTELLKNPEKANNVKKQLETARIESQHKSAEAINMQANEHFRSKNYSKAEELYSKAIDTWHDDIRYYGNRCTCRIMLGDYKRALKDSRDIISLDKTYVKGYDRLIRCCLVYGHYDEAGQASEKLQEQTGFDKKVLIDLCTKISKLRGFEQLIAGSYADKQFLSALLHIDRGLQVLPESIHLKLWKAECFMCLGEVEKIQEMEEKCSDADRFYLKSLCSYYEGNLSAALTQLKQALADDPNHYKARIMQTRLEQQKQAKDNGDLSFKFERFHKAVGEYTKAIELEHFDSDFVFHLLYSRASAQSKIGNFREAINDCDRALTLYSSDVKMRLLRANCYYYLDEFENAIEDFETALNADQGKMNSEQTREIESKITDLKTASRREKAKKRKSEADKLVEANRFQAASECFAKAIDLYPENISFYEDRAYCFMKMNKYEQAIRDYKSALTMNGYCSLRGYYDMINCCLICGDTSGAEITIRKFNSSIISKNDSTVNGYMKQCNELIELQSSAYDWYNRKRYELAVCSIDEALKIATDSTKLKLLKGECLALMDCFKEANEIATSCSKSNPDAIYVRALCLIQKDYDSAKAFMREAVRLDPDHEKAKLMLQKMKKTKEKEEMGDNLLQQGKYKEAIVHYSEAIEISPPGNPSLPTIIYNRALANVRSKTKVFRTLNQTIKDCTEAIKNRWTLTAGSFLKLRAECYMNMRNFRKSVEDCEALVKIDSSNEVAAALLKQAQSALKRSQSDNYYDILDIGRNATTLEIKKAYQNLAQLHHPDKHSNASSDEKYEQGEIFKRINNAHIILSDPDKRRKYDKRN